MRSNIAAPRTRVTPRTAPLRVALALSLDASDLELLRRILAAWRTRDSRAGELLQRIARRAA